VFVQGDSAEEHHVVTSDLLYELTGLSKFTEYIVWVVAFNQNGPGSSTEEVACRTLSDVPSEPPQNVTLEATSSTVSHRKNMCCSLICGYKERRLAVFCLNRNYPSSDS